MNKTREKQIAKLADQLRDLYTELDTLKDEEQDSFDNTPESLQQGERGTRSQECIDAMESALSDIESAVTSLEGVG